MKRDVHGYEAEDITVSYDVERCIHVRECVRGLPSVFDPDRRPWIPPEGADPHGRNYYWKSMYLDELGDDCIDLLVERASVAPSSHSSVTLWQLGGEMNRVDADDTAFPHRDAAFMLSVEATWDDPHASSENQDWARETWERLWERSDRSLYVNFPGLAEDRTDVMRAAFGPHYERLAELKAEYDPTTLFRSHGGLSLAGGTTGG